MFLIGPNASFRLNHTESRDIKHLGVFPPHRSPGEREADRNEAFGKSKRGIRFHLTAGHGQVAGGDPVPEAKIMIKRKKKGEGMRLREINAVNNCEGG